MASRSTSQHAEVAGRDHHVVQQIVVDNSRHASDSSPSRTHYRSDSLSYSSSSPSSSTVNNAGAGVATGENWTSEQDFPREIILRKSLNKSCFGRKTPVNPSRCPRIPIEPIPVDVISAKVFAGGRCLAPLLDKSSLSEKERYYSCKRKPDPASKAAPFCERRLSVKQDVSGGLFPTPIPIRCDDEAEIEKLLSTSFVYTEQLEFTTQAWEMLNVLTCACHRCMHPADNNHCAVDEAAVYDEKEVDGSCACKHRQDNFRRTCREEGCMFSYTNTYNIVAPLGNGKIKVVLYEDDQPLVYECGMLCSCYPNCQWSVVLKGPNKSLSIELYFARSFGWGVRTKLPIVANQFLFEYVGRVVSNDQQVFNYAAGKRNDYMFDNDLLTVDAGRQGNIARWLNHSCRPNCVVMCSYVGHTFVEVSRLVVVTKRLVYADQPLTIDYGAAWWLAQFRAKQLTCLCGEDDCRFTQENLEAMGRENEKQERKSEAERHRQRGREVKRERADEVLDNEVDEDYASSRMLLNHPQQKNEADFDRPDSSELTSFRPKANSFTSLKKPRVFKENAKPVNTFERRISSDENVLKLRGGRVLKRRLVSSKNLDALLTARKKRKKPSLTVARSSSSSPTRRKNYSPSKQERLRQLFSCGKIVNGNLVSPSKRVVDKEAPAAEPMSRELLNARKELALAAKFELRKVQQPRKAMLNAKSAVKEKRKRSRRSSPQPQAMQMRQRFRQNVDEFNGSFDAGPSTFTKRNGTRIKNRRRTSPQALQHEDPLLKGLSTSKKPRNGEIFDVRTEDSRFFQVVSELEDTDADEAPGKNLSSAPRRVLPPQRARAAAAAASKSHATESDIFGDDVSSTTNGDYMPTRQMRRAIQNARSAVAKKVPTEEQSAVISTPPVTSNMMLTRSRQHRTASATPASFSDQSINDYRSYSSATTSPTSTLTPPSRSNSQIRQEGCKKKNKKLTERDVFGSLTPSLAGSPQKLATPRTNKENVWKVMEKSAADSQKQANSLFSPFVVDKQPLASLSSFLSPTTSTSTTAFGLLPMTMPSSIASMNGFAPHQQRPTFGQRAIKFGLSTNFTSPGDASQMKPTPATEQPLLMTASNTAAAMNHVVTAASNIVTDHGNFVDVEDVAVDLSFKSKLSFEVKQPSQQLKQLADQQREVVDELPLSNTSAGSATAPATVVTVAAVEAPLSLPTKAAAVVTAGSDTVLLREDAALGNLTILHQSATSSAAASSSNKSNVETNAEAAAADLAPEPAPPVAAAATISKQPLQSATVPPPPPPILIDVDSDEENVIAAITGHKTTSSFIGGKQPANTEDITVSTDDDDEVVLVGQSPPATDKMNSNRCNSAANHEKKRSVLGSNSAMAKKSVAKKSLMPSLSQQLPSLASALQLLSEKCLQYPFRYIGALSASSFAQLSVQQMCLSLGLASSLPSTKPSASSSPMSSSSSSSVNQNRYKLLFVSGSDIRNISSLNSLHTVEHHVCAELKLKLESTVLVLAESVRCHAGAQCRIDQWPDVNMTYTLKCHVCGIPHHVACYASSRKQADKMLTYVKQIWKGSNRKLEFQLTCGACAAAEEQYEVDEADDADVDDDDDDAESSSNDVKLIISIKRPVAKKRRRSRPPVAAEAAPAQSVAKNGEASVAITSSTTFDNSTSKPS